MSRPQKYRARKHIKEVSSRPQSAPFRNPSSEISPSATSIPLFSNRRWRATDIHPPASSLVSQIMNKRHNDRAQAMAVKNSSQVAKKIYAQFQACVDACEGPECVQECEAEWNM